MTSKDQLDLNIRFDQLLYFLRIYKTRSTATKEIEKGSCKVNNFLIKKKNKTINIGDVITVKYRKIYKQIKILKIPLRRGPFKESVIHYEDITPLSLKKNIENKFLEKISRGSRPTKSNRRKLEKFTSRIF